MGDAQDPLEMSAISQALSTPLGDLFLPSLFTGEAVSCATTLVYLAGLVLLVCL